MGGKRLTDVVMKKLQKFYGKAIRSNIGDAKSMQDAVMAIYYHSSSTDSHPQHFLCSPGLTSWCKFKRCKVTGETPPPHHTTIHPEMDPFVSAEFEKLSDPALMERCVLGATQNQSESFQQHDLESVPED